MSDAEGIVLTGLKAVIDNDDETLSLLQSTLTPDDYRTAISVLADVFQDVALLLDKDIHEMLEHFRRGLNAET